MKNHLKQITTIAIMLILSISVNAQWSQLGQDIDGEAADDFSGCSISISSDGSVVAIGASGNDGIGTNSGHVRIYENISGTWTQIGTDIDGETVNDDSGWSVSLSADGSVVAIGAQHNNGNGVDAGHVRIYKNLSGIWTQIGSDIDGEVERDHSGCSVSLNSDGSVIAIGAYKNDLYDTLNTERGHVRIYRDSSGIWVQVGVDINGEAAWDESGKSVSLSADGSIVAIGAHHNDGNGFNAGHVRIYKNISGTWTQIGNDIDGEAAGDRFGYYVSLSADGTVVAIGAPWNDGNGSDAGHVRIYKNISGTWTQIGNDIDGEVADDLSGGSVSLNTNGSIVAIGASGSDSNGSESGHVRIYENIAGTWIQIGVNINGEASYDGSGYSVSISADSLVVAIGAKGNDGNGISAGHVRIYYNCSSYDTIFPIVCDTTYYSSPSGKLWISTGTYIDTIASGMGCDSIITINLTINSSTSDTIAVVCDSITWYGTTYYSSAMPTHAFTNVAGCDSVVTLNLTIDTVDVSVTQNVITLTANLVGASYQWVDCNNSYAIISGETNQSFTPVVNGNYAVIIDDGICIDTSICYVINGIGIDELNNTIPIILFPNPTTGKLTIQCDNMQQIEILDITGKLLYQTVIANEVKQSPINTLNIDISTYSKGIYFIKVTTTDATATQRIILE